MKKEDIKEMTEDEKTRAYLNRLKTIDKRIKFKLEEAEKWRGIAENHTSHISDVKVQNSPKQDKMADAVANALLYEQESYALANELVEQKRKMIDQIYNMEERYCPVLNLYFMQNKSYKEIESELNYTYNKVKQTLRKGIKSFGTRYNEDIENYITQICGKY